MMCLRELEAKRDLFEHAPDQAELSLVKISMRHFLKALDEVELSTTRDVVSEVPVVHWENIGGLESAKKLLKDSVSAPSIIFFDEVDALVPERKKDSTAGHISERTTG